MPTRRPREETARLGDEIYERKIRPHLEDTHRGEYIAIDVESGSWAIAGDTRGAAEGLRARQPDATDIWLLRIGYRAMARIGGGSLRSTG